MLKTIACASIIHHRPQYPSYRGAPCKAELVHTPRNYSVQWNDVNCTNCLGWRKEQADKKLYNRIVTLRAKCERDKALLIELEKQLAERLRQ